MLRKGSELAQIPALQLAASLPLPVKWEDNTDLTGCL